MIIVYTHALWPGYVITFTSQKHFFNQTFRQLYSAPQSFKIIHINQHTDIYTQVNDEVYTCATYL